MNIAFVCELGTTMEDVITIFGFNVTMDNGVINTGGIKLQFWKVT